MNPLHSILANLWSTLMVVVFFGGSIFVHELGHFVAARRRGLRVERFSIGFGPAIWSHRGRDGVEYRLAWIPFGGYVLLPQLADLAPIEGKSDVAAADLPAVGYASKMIVFAGGAAFNLLFAFCLACVISVIGQPASNMFETTRIGYVQPVLRLQDGSSVPSPASVAGLKAGDTVQAVDGHAVTDWNILKELLATSAGRDARGRPRATFTILRDGRAMDVTVLPVLEREDQYRQVGIAPACPAVVYQVEPGSPAAKAGILAGDEIIRADGSPVLSFAAIDACQSKGRRTPIALVIRRAGIETAVAIPAAIAGNPDADLGIYYSPGLHMVYPSPFAQISEQVTMTFRTLWSLLNPHSDIGLSKMAGPIGIVHIFNIAVENGLREVFGFTILVNVNLAIFNLLPIPVLDGGQILFATIGRLRRRALPANFVAATQSLFMVLLFSMIIYVSYFNVRHWVSDARAERAALPPAKP